MQTIQSSSIPIELSFNNGVNWQKLVCLEAYNVPLQKSVQKTETFCGTAVGLGAADFNPQGTAVCEVAPTSDQVTYKTLLQYFDSEVSFLFRVMYPGSGSTGNSFYLSGSCKVTSLDLQFSNNEVVKFAWTLSGEGELDITP